MTKYLRTSPVKVRWDTRDTQNVRAYVKSNDSNTVYVVAAQTTDAAALVGSAAHEILHVLCRRGVVSVDPALEEAAASDFGLDAKAAYHDAQEYGPLEDWPLYFTMRSSVLRGLKEAGP